MSLRNTIRTAALAAAIGTAVLAVPSTSWAADNFLDQCGGATVSCQTGTSSAAPADADYCKIESSTRTRVCVKYVGDIVWVKDDAADGNSALARLNGDQGSIHQRFCRNPHGAGSWARCNFDWAENSLLDVYGGVRNSQSSYTVTWLGLIHG